MSSQSKIMSVFPNVAWTGGSDIHCSKAGNMMVDEKTSEFLLKADPATVMRVLVRAEYHKIIHRHIAGSGIDFEPFMSEDEFNKLVYYLSQRSLEGQNPSMRGKRIINPHTKNVFIPIGAKDGVVAAIRFWAGGEEAGGEVFCAGYRIRCEVVSAREAHGRARAAIDEMKRITEEVKEYEEVANYLEVAEPVSEEEASLRVRIRELGGE